MTNITKKLTKNKTRKPNKKSRYHHGDLQVSLIKAATLLITNAGVENLSLRKLAEKVGVSRTAAYHHFKDKNDLLCAIATQGFIKWQAQSKAIFDDDKLSNEMKFRQFVHAYVKFATDNPCLYDLMFGRIIWKEAKSTQALREVAYPIFQYQVEMTKIWQKKGIMPNTENTLRLAQVTWGTLHGIARLSIDGIYENTSNIEEMCECAVKLFLT
ncbi:MAG: TetR/AcrR family transcriptional regulator [Alteromonadaceae bacterium]|nr:TetR/AcrR family transcriptional regulator [Alteromonadaceae bacterium]